MSYCLTVSQFTIFVSFAFSDYCDGNSVFLSFSNPFFLSICTLRLSFFRFRLVCMIFYLLLSPNSILYAVYVYYCQLSRCFLQMIMFIVLFFLFYSIFYCDFAQAAPEWLCWYWLFFLNIYRDFTSMVFSPCITVPAGRNLSLNPMRRRTIKRRGEYAPECMFSALWKACKLHRIRCLSL